MSVKYRNQNGQETIIAGLTPGGNLEAGAVATRSGSFNITFNGSATSEGNVAVTFDQPMPDADYDVSFSYNGQWTGVSLYANQKTANGFNVCYTNIVSSTATRTYNYKAIKTYTVQHAQENAEDIATLKAVVPASASSTNQLTTKSYVDNADNALDTRLDDIEDVIPTGASVTNQLATSNDVARDATPTAGSTKLVESGGVKTALDTKQNTLTFDNTPTENSNNPVKSNGIYDADKAIQDQVNDIVNVYGSKNLLPNYAPNTATSNNVTFTKQSDGTIVLTTSAAASAYTTLGLYSNAYPTIKNESGLIVSAMGNGISLRIADQDGTWYGSSNKEILIPAGKNVVTAALAVQQGATFNGTVAKPMIRAASITDNTYAPYAMTNRELTETLDVKQDKLHLIDVSLTMAANTREIWYTVPTINTATGWILAATIVYNATENYTDMPHAILNTATSGRIGLVKSSNVSAATTYKVRLLWTTKPIYDNG